MSGGASQMQVDTAVELSWIAIEMWAPRIIAPIKQKYVFFAWWSGHERFNQVKMEIFP